MKESRIKELFKNTALFTIANLSSKVIVFLMVPFYTAVMSTDAFGNANIIQTTSSFLYPIFSCLIADAVLRFCYLKEVSINEIFTIGLRFSLLSGIGTFLLVTLVQFFIPEDFWSLNIWFIPILVLSTSLSRLLHCFCRGIDKVKISAVAGIIQTFFVVGLNLIFLGLLNWGTWSYLLAFALGDIGGILFIAIRIKVWNYIGAPKNKILLHSMLRYSLPLVPNNISWWAMNSLNQYIVLIFIGLSAVGIYTATLRIPSILIVLSDIFAQAWLLSALKDYEQEETKQFIIKMSGLFTSFIIIITSIIIILTYPLSSLMLKGEFLSYWYISPFMFISVLLGAITGFLGSIFSAERKNKKQATSTVIGAILSIVGALIFTKSFGILAIAISTMIGYFVITAIRLVSALKYIKLNINLITITNQTVILIIEAVLVIHQLYYFAILPLFILILINLNNLKQIMAYTKSFIIQHK